MLRNIATLIFLACSGCASNEFVISAEDSDCDKKGKINHYLLSNGSKEVLSPVFIHNPWYPGLAMQYRLTGYAVVKVEIRPNGTVKNPSIVDSCPSDVFEKTSLNAAKKLRYEPIEDSADEATPRYARYKYTYVLSQ